jgi:imidazolonepropionase-like amidohydrolase
VRESAGAGAGGPAGAGAGGLAGAGARGPARAGARGSRLITAGRVLLGDGDVLDDAAVLVEHGRIAWVGPAPEAGRLAYGETDSFPGGCLVPGLIDAHVHLCFRYGADLTAPAEDAAAVAATVALHCGRLLKAGVTTVRDLGSAGRAVQQARDAIARGELDGPRIRCSGRPVTTAGGHLSSFGLAASGEAGLAAAVAAVARDGADTVKIVATGGAGTPGTPLGRAQFTTGELRAAVRAAAGLGLPVAAHAHGTEGIARAVAAGVHTVEHCSWMDLAGGIGSLDPAVLAEMRRRRQIGVIAGPLPPALAGQLASGVPALAAPAPAGPSSGSPAAPPSASPDGPSSVSVATADPAGRTRAIWRNARVSREHGVAQALGTDAMFGQFDDDHDLAWRAQGLVEQAGWPAAHVLEALWRGGAAALGSPGLLGAIAPGAHADLVVLGGDPGADIRALHDVRAVYRAGLRCLEPAVKPSKLVGY